MIARAAFALALVAACTPARILAQEVAAPAPAQAEAVVEQLTGNLAAIQTAGMTSPALVTTLEAALMACADGVAKPSKGTVAQLASDLAAIVEDGVLSPADLSQLAGGVRRVLAATGTVSEATSQAVEDVQALLFAAGADAGDIGVLKADLQAIMETGGSSQLQPSNLPVRTPPPAAVPASAPSAVPAQEPAGKERLSRKERKAAAAAASAPAPPPKG